MHCNGNGKKDSPLFLCFDQEPITKNLNSLIEQIIDDWGQGKRIVLVNTENNSVIKNQILSKYNVIDCNYFFHIFAASDWYRGYQYCSDIIDPMQRHIKKKYITFNRITGHSRAYRSLFIAYLHENKLLKYGHVSYSDICPVHGDYKSNLCSLKDLHNVDNKIINSAIQNISQIEFPLRIDNEELQFIPNGSQTIDALPQLMESFLYIVTETCFWENKHHLTEKIFRPIITKHPFVLLGCADNLRYLKKYGFKTFENWWDESYDQIDDPIERMKAVVNIITQLSKLNNLQLEKMLKEMKPVLDYNFELFYSSSFIKNAWQELNTNLQNATRQATKIKLPGEPSDYILNMTKTDKTKYRYNPFNELSWLELQANIAKIQTSNVNI